MTDIDIIYETAKKALIQNRVRKSAAFYSESLKREIKVEAVSLFEMAELMYGNESFSVWINRVIYAAVPELKELGEKMFNEGLIKEPCEAAGVFSDPEKEKLYGILLSLAEYAEDTKEKLKNSFAAG